MGTAPHAELSLRREYEGTLVLSLSTININVSSWIDEYNAYTKHSKYFTIVLNSLSL